MKHEQSRDLRLWTEPPSPDDEPEPGYEERLAEEIEKARADFAAGRFVTLDELKKELGLE